MKARLTAVSVLIALVSTLLPAVAAAGAWLLSPNEYYTELRGNRFSSDRMWDANGESVNLADVATFEQRSLTSYTELGWKPWLSVSFSVPFVSRTFRAATTDFESTETGIGDVTLGARIGLIQGPTAVSVEAILHAPAGYDRNHFPPLGTGTDDVTGLVAFGTSMPAIQAFADLAAGYRYRFEDPLNEFVADATAGFWVGSGLLLSGRYQSYTTVESSDTPGLEGNLHAAGPEVRYRVDDMLDVFAGWSHTFKGENAMDTDDVYVGAAFRQTTLNRLQGILGNKQRP